MKTRWLFLILFIFIIFSSLAEGQDKKIKNQNKNQLSSQKRYLNLRDKLFSDMQLFERTFQGDTDFLQLEQEIRQMLQEQLRGSMSDEEIQELLNPSGGFGNAFENDSFGTRSRNSGSLEWSETDAARILKVKIKMPKDQALDIKIEKNQIKVSGKIKNANQMSQFSQAVSVPSDCDATQAKIEVDKEGYAQVILPKRMATKTKALPKTEPTPGSSEEKQPVAPSGQGVAI